MKTAILPKFLALVGVACMAAPALAQDAPSADGKMLFAQGTGGEHKRLSLTDAQKSKLKELRNQFILATAEKKALLQVQRGELRDLMKADNVDKSAVLALHAKTTALKNELSLAKLNFLLAANDVFTPEQKSLMRERRMGGHCGGGGCGGRGGFGRRGGFGHQGRFGQRPGGVTSFSAPAATPAETDT